MQHTDKRRLVRFSSHDKCLGHFFFFGFVPAHSIGVRHEYSATKMKAEALLDDPRQILPGQAIFYAIFCAFLNV
ncbi:MAG: hypothetical protein DMG58_09925 [Acidobacteria bacterium]|nr:MAG: hypothetical protein DMG58_09925 [Acidobacteriota bacterium]